MILSANDFTGYHLGTVLVAYSPKGIKTEAVQVTAENVGALSLELDEELRYYDTGEPFIQFRAQRGTDDEPKTPAVVTLRVTDWLVCIGDELRMFRDFEFKRTFAIIQRNAHELSVDHSSAEATGFTTAVEPNELYDNVIAPVSSGDFAPGGPGLLVPGTDPGKFVYDENIRPMNDGIREQN